MTVEKPEAGGVAEVWVDAIEFQALGDNESSSCVANSILHEDDTPWNKAQVCLTIPDVHGDARRGASGSSGFGNRLRAARRAGVRKTLSLDMVSGHSGNQRAALPHGGRA